MGVNFRINLDSFFVFCKCPIPGVTEEGLVVNSHGKLNKGKRLLSQRSKSTETQREFWFYLVGNEEYRSTLPGRPSESEITGFAARKSRSGAAGP